MNKFSALRNKKDKLDNQPVSEQRFLSLSAPCGKKKRMHLYECIVCRYVYDPARGDSRQFIQSGTVFSALPADWHCPECGVGQESFKRLEKCQKKAQSMHK